MTAFPELDLADECNWEDHPSIIYTTLEEAHLEESSSQPLFGLSSAHTQGIEEYVSWWLDDDDDASALQLH